MRRGRDGRGQGFGKSARYVAAASGTRSGRFRHRPPWSVPVPSFYVAAYQFKERAEEFWEKGVSAFRTTIPAKQSYLATIKSIDYLPNVLMKREAMSKGYDFPICFTTMGFLAEGATENICMVNPDGELVVPEFTNCLAGTTMRRGIETHQPGIARALPQDQGGRTL